MAQVEHQRKSLRPPFALTRAVICRTPLSHRRPRTPPAAINTASPAPPTRSGGARGPGGPRRGANGAAVVPPVIAPLSGTAVRGCTLAAHALALPPPPLPA